MKCPVCPDSTLSITHRENIEIDYCPNCRGVWLDRGELDKIIERSAPLNAPQYRDEEHPEYQEKNHKGHYKKKKKKGGWLGDLFEFGD